jgi:hypothetical protein
MDPQSFVKALDGRKVRFTRTCLATGRVEGPFDVVPDSPLSTAIGAGIGVRGTIHCYHDTDLFAFDFGVYVAVVKTGAGHLFCDRFEPIQETTDEQN